MANSRSISEGDQVTYKPRPGLQVRRQPGKVLATEAHKLQVQPLRYGQPAGPPLWLKRGLVQPAEAPEAPAPLRRSIAVIRAIGSGVVCATVARPDLLPQIKPARPVRCRRYLAFVRQHPCCSCGGGPSEAHHFGPRGVSQKTDDLRTVPLCRRCHQQLHGKGTLCGMDAAATVTYLLRVQVDLLVEYFSSAA